MFLWSEQKCYTVDVPPLLILAAPFIAHILYDPRGRCYEERERERDTSHHMHRQIALIHEVMLFSMSNTRDGNCSYLIPLDASAYLSDS